MYGNVLNAKKATTQTAENARNAALIIVTSVLVNMYAKSVTQATILLPTNQSALMNLQTVQLKMETILSHLCQARDSVTNVILITSGPIQSTTASSAQITFIIVKLAMQLRLATNASSMPQ